ncbi:MAG: hypothetical protein ABIG44_14580 [Planctomycetota bacterium]
MESKDLWVELKRENPGYMVLRGTYGEKIHRSFHLSRQGVRWRFHRVFNDVYILAFESILLIEKTFGTQLREHAISISRQRYELRQRALQSGFQTAGSLIYRQQSGESAADRRPTEM